MPTELKNSIRKALAGSSSQQPVDTSKLYPLGTRKQVQAALMDMYQAHEVYCCKTIKGGQESVVWWTVGGVSAPHSYGRVGIVITVKPPRPSRMSDLAQSVLQKVKASPGISRADLLAFGCAQQTIKNPQQVKGILGNLSQGSLIIGSGTRRSLTYTTGEAK